MHVAPQKDGHLDVWQAVARLLQHKAVDTIDNAEQIRTLDVENMSAKTQAYGDNAFHREGNQKTRAAVARAHHHLEVESCNTCRALVYCILRDFPLDGL